MKYFQILISICIGLIFMVIGIVSLPYYGPNWDEPVHFGRGQAILHYFFTGKKDYKDLSPKQALRRSYYQHDYYSYTYFEKASDEGKKFAAGTGHPVVSDIIASLFNRMFYQRLQIIGDIESYHLYSVTIAAALVAILFYVVASTYGVFAGIVAALSLVLTPLFLGESRFNIKDVPEAVFYACTLLTLYQGVVKNNWKWILLSSFFSGLAFGTKLNIIFAAVSAVMWLFIIYQDIIRKNGWRRFFITHKFVLLSFLSYPIVSLIFYFGSWPLLWKDPINRFLYNLNYYQTIATAGGSYAEFTTLLGFNTYALQWIIFSTPLVTLGLVAIGLFGYLIKKNRPFFLLVLLWFIVPIIRVSLPGFVIYGGVRQIMEYIPAMAILAGVGANYIITLLHGYMVTLKNRNIKQFNNVTIKQLGIVMKIMIILSFLPIAFKIAKMYPNESVYFNPIIGGLKGAKERNIPGWGNTLGSTYRQGVKWLNEHAEQGAKLAFVYELRSNIPIPDLRSDFELNNHVRSAVQRKGEYVIGVTHDGTQENSYNRKYLERFLDPVYTVSVEGVPVLKIWKNDLEHSKPEYQKREQLFKDFLVYLENGNVIVDLRERHRITKVFIRYPVTASCTLPTNGYFQYSPDGIHWDRETADFSFFPLASWFTPQPEPGVLQFLFAAEHARYIKLVILDEDSCLLLQPLYVEVSII